MPIEKIDDLGIAACHSNLHAAVRRLRQVQRDDVAERLQWLESLAQEAAVDRPGEDWKLILRRLVTATKSKALHRKLTAILTPERTNLDHVDVPLEQWYYSPSQDEVYEFDNGIFRAHTRIAEDLFATHAVSKILPADATVVETAVGNEGVRMLTPSLSSAPRWKKITKASEMEDWLLRRNKRHLQQMYLEESPPTHQSFTTITGHHGTSETVDAILEGDYNIDGTDLPLQMKQWLKTMQRTPKEKDLTIQVEMTPKQFQEAFKAADEKTSSSPSGLHYTLWKAIAEKDDLCAYFSTMLNLPFMYGFVNDRWTKGIDVMLAKQHGNSQIHMNRLIGLLEADFNTALMWYYPVQIMGNAESSGLNPNQWGGREPDCYNVCYKKTTVMGIRSIC
eukprot:g13554.t1 g13554   contig8:946492-947667(+)